jgi:hypothetical protein
LTHVIPDTKSRIDAGVIEETLSKLKAGFITQAPTTPAPTPQKRCVLRVDKKDVEIDVQAASSGWTCQSLANSLPEVSDKESYALACVLKVGSGEQTQILERAIGSWRGKDETPVAPGGAGNFCKWVDTPRPAAPRN